MDFISIFDISPADLKEILEESARLKRRRASGERQTDELRGRTLLMIFEKPSTRTRVSFEVAMRELGGSVISLSWNEMQLGRGERIKETAKVLSSYVDAVCIRAFSHEKVEEFAEHATIPTINALTDREHPCQTLADMLTIKERKGSLKGLKVAWIGDGNNVCNSLIGGCTLCGAEIWIACPKGYEPDAEIMRKAHEIGGNVHVCDDVMEAAEDADVLYTDVWVSMGDERDSARRKNDLRSYQINQNVLRNAKEDAIVMHCMPVHVGEEMTEDVLYCEQSAVLQQAENRLHTQKALLMRILS
ncbi:MAG: ornithine carbamoyltransferase [Canidatus Methanoxibalbensis ujae]|nr:ornithine carbamoyltransferase [Candidatus Methanoxibalbensis ujae]MCW7078078.1 ornithine carbamoyltransferase [Candidatus Methanoxibalbensis ujae]